VVKPLARKLMIPPGVDREDIEGVGLLAVVQAAEVYDDTLGVPWRAFATQKARWAMIDELNHNARRGDLNTLRRAEGGGVHVPRADNPATVAEARDTVLTGRVGRIADGLPPPDVVAERVQQLRAVMYGQLKEADIAAMMTAVMDKAKTGNVGAAKLIVEMLSPAKAGVKTVIQQQAIVINPEDL